MDAPPSLERASNPPAAPQMRARDAQLLCRIQRRFGTRSEQLTLSGGLSLRFTRIADPDRVLDDVAAAEDLRERLSGQRAAAEQLHLPYWAELWESASGIANHLIEQCAQRSDAKPFPLKGLSFLDLGCGMGLAGTAAAMLGARVLFADLSPDALLFAALNSSPWRNRVRTRRLDWRHDELHEPFDLILGADILYEKAQWYFLDPFWRAHLREGGHILLGEPGRQTGELFVPWIMERGWSLIETSQSSPTRPKPLRIFKLQRALR